MPSRVKLSVTRWLIMPTIKAHQTMVMSTRMTDERASRIRPRSQPVRARPTKEWEMVRWPPRRGERMKPKTDPPRNFFHSPEVG